MVPQASIQSPGLRVHTLTIAYNPGAVIMERCKPEQAAHAGKLQSFDAEIAKRSESFKVVCTAALKSRKIARPLAWRWQTRRSDNTAAGELDELTTGSRTTESACAGQKVDRVAAFSSPKIMPERTIFRDGEAGF